MNRPPKLSVLASCLAAGLAPLVAMAQSSPAADAQQLQEVVVTAQKRVERIQEAPVAVTALSEEGLEALNVVSVATLQVAVPNVAFANALGQSTMLAFIRGIGTANPVFSSDPAVGIYIDDVYLTRALGANMDFFDIERVEVLRGPQGTLYGANSPAGAIRISTLKPDLREGFALRGRATIASFNGRGIDLSANVPLVDKKVAARLVIQGGSSGGNQTNLVDGSKAGTRDFTSVRLHVLGKVDDNWSVLLSANDFNNKTIPLNGVNFSGAGGVDLFLTPGFNKRDFNSELKVRYDNTQSRGLTLDVNGNLGWADFRSITARRTLGSQSRSDGDAKTSSLFDNNQVLSNKQVTQEFNLSGQSGALKWLAGAYLIHEQTDFGWQVRVLGSVVNPPLGLAPNFELYDQTKKSWSVFTHESFAVSDQLTLSGALRWTQESKDFHVAGYTPTVFPDYGLPEGTPIAGFDLQRKKSWSAAQWRVAADYKLSRDAFGFASVSRGFRSGGFNGGARSIAEAAADPFNPEYVTAYEAGVKTEWLARKLRVNATVFQNDYKDQQVAFLSSGVNFGTSTQNAKIYGMELETLWLPMAGLRLFANAGLMHGSTDSSVNRFVPNAKYQYSVGADYSGSLAPGLGWFIGSNYFRTAGFDRAASLDPLRRQEAYGDLGARIGLASDDGKWKLELSGTNLLNDYWSVFSFNIPNLFTVRTPNQQRAFALKLSFNH